MDCCMLIIKMILCEINKNAKKDEILYKYFFDSFKNNYIIFFQVIRIMEFGILNKQCLYLCLTMFIECIWLDYKSY